MCVYTQKHKNMRNIIKYYISMIACLMLSLPSVAQMYVWQDGKIILTIDKGLADSITFEKPHGVLSNFQFSVAADHKVRFSKGNLQYCDMYFEWRFAENQYDVIGTKNSLIGEMNEDWIDLFGWGTFGYCFEIEDQPDECHYTYETSTDYRDYLIKGDWRNGLVGDCRLADWGIANKNYIINGDKEDWRTLTSAEWGYLFTQRPDAAKKFALATVNGQKGLIVLADNWRGVPKGLTFTPAYGSKLVYSDGFYQDDEMVDDHFATNIYTKEQWTLMENAGALFLPAAGRRWGTDVKNLGHADMGYYWSTTAGAQEREGNVCALFFYQSGVTPTGETSRAWGCSVRLVQDIE